MKKLACVLFFYYSLLVIASPQMAITHLPLFARGSKIDTAKVIIYRPKALSGFAQKAEVKFGNTSVKIKNNSIETCYIPIGSYEIYNHTPIMFAKKKKFTLTLEPNKTYYLRYRYINNVFWATDEFIQVDSVFAANEINRLNLKNQ